MTKKKLKINEPDEAELKARKFLNRSWKFIRKESIRIVRWMFFYRPENKMNATLHIIDITVLIYIAFRLMKIS